MSNEIKNTNGTIDKYMGDAIMAFWNAPTKNKNHPKDTCLSALNCQSRLKTLREKWEKEDKPLFYTRIGINTGKVMIGNVGSDYKMDYTIYELLSTKDTTVDFEWIKAYEGYNTPRF